MADIVDLGQPIVLTGKSGLRYMGSILGKEAQTTYSGKAIVCLSNSAFSNHDWEHKVNSVFHADNVQLVMNEFGNRDDVSHIVIIPHDHYKVKRPDAVDDLIRNYIHK